MTWLRLKKKFSNLRNASPNWKPARGGSKRVKRKNIRPLAEKPLIAYTIQSAIKSKKINRLIVSTDDPEIAKVAEEYGAEVPFLRPASLAQDDTPDQPVFQHALESLKEHDGYEPDIVVHLRPTTPLKTPQTIDKVIEKMRETKADIVRTMTPVEDMEEILLVLARNHRAHGLDYKKWCNVGD